MKRSEERIQFLEDIISTAVEGGTNYWASVSHYQWVDRLPWKPEEYGRIRVVCGQKNDRTDTYAVLEDMEGEDNRNLNVTADVVAHGIAVLTQGKTSTHESYVKRIAEASRENDCGLLDSSDCDIIVQAGLFDDVLYG